LITNTKYVRKEELTNRSALTTTSDEDSERRKEDQGRWKIRISLEEDIHRRQIKIILIAVKIKDFF
jgi:hypothetical protein